MNHPESPITFAENGVLLLNKHIIDAADSSEEHIYDVVDDNALTIYAHMHELMNETDPYREKGRHALPPVILVARLALLKERTEVLSKRAIESPSTYHLSFDDVREGYTSYWTMVKHAKFVPVLHELATPPEHAGVWLGVYAAHLSMELLN